MKDGKEHRYWRVVERPLKTSRAKSVLKTELTKKAFCLCDREQ
jgi:hypothetical protein